MTHLLIKRKPQYHENVIGIIFPKLPNDVDRLPGSIYGQNDEH